jgi:hypothetical protein
MCLEQESGVCSALLPESAANDGWMTHAALAQPAGYDDKPCT